jgi:hypothetical protein
VGFLAILSAETVSTRAVLTVGTNVHITSGKETGITNASWNVCKCEKQMNKIALRILLSWSIC